MPGSPVSSTSSVQDGCAIIVPDNYRISSDAHRDGPLGRSYFLLETNPERMRKCSGMEAWKVAQS
jgi:hypothetical protein